MILLASEEIQQLREALAPYRQRGCFLDSRQVTNLLTWLNTIRALARETEEESRILANALKARDSQDQIRRQSLHLVAVDFADPKVVPLAPRPKHIKPVSPDGGDAA